MACKVKSGIIQVIGEFDVGKTTFALENGWPAEQIIFVDDDVKGKAITGVDFAKYIDFAQMCKGKSDYEVYLATIEVIESVKRIAKEKNAKVLIWDTWTRAGDSFVEEVKKHPQNFVEKMENGKYWKGNVQIITGTQYKYAALHETAVLNELQSHIPLIFLITHVKNKYDGGVVTGVKAASSRALNKICYFRVWLRRNLDSPIPIALTMKRINEKYADERGRLRTKNVLPPRIVPNIVLPEENIEYNNDESLWDTIERYFDNPVGRRELLEQEMPNEEENAILSGTMTKEQRLAWILQLKQKQEEEELIELQSQKDRAIQLQKQGMNFSQIKDELDVPLNTVISWLT